MTPTFLSVDWDSRKSGQEEMPIHRGTPAPLRPDVGSANHANAVRFSVANEDRAIRVHKNAMRPV